MDNDNIVDKILGMVPPDLLGASGSLLYSGRDAFSGSSPLYLMGINPGGDPDELVQSSIHSDTDWMLRDRPANWSRYRDESWGPGAAPGTWKMQPRVLHLLNRLGLDPGEVPSSNLIFVRSRREADLARDHMTSMAEACWPFHQAVIERLGVRVVVCFGGTVSGFVRGKLGANQETDRFVEVNKRNWTSRTFRAPSGLTVVQATHPSIADWCNPNTDVSDLVARALLAAA
ncbi:hypothetical protein ASD81_13210 [Nocardioides sp. Root614]|nr:hypothetical protein ASD81_13210 [Nocardioides sp. Root614]KRA89163.1 hypothetical protein ASD84_13475 [Nocardioides sp. Root682]